MIADNDAELLYHPIQDMVSRSGQRTVQAHEKRERATSAVSCLPRTTTVGLMGIIEDKKTTAYHHPSRDFSSTAELGGKEKWTAYKVTKSVYDI